MSRRFRAAAVASAALALTVSGIGLAPGRSAATTEVPATVDFVLPSFDGTPINAHFFPATGLTAGRRAPVIMLAHGFGEAGPSDRSGPRLAGAPRVSVLVDAGFDVLTWDARGMGASGGTARLDSPDAEVRDVERLIDWLAARPEVELDKPGDPRIGMTGASYGGIIQYLSAALDHRIDVIAPAYTAYSLSNTTLAPAGKFKEGWGLLLSAISVGTIPPGLTSPLGPQLHGIDPPLLTGMISGDATGQLSPAFRRYLYHRSPSAYLSRIHIPTLVTGGTSDTLFPLVNADHDYRYLHSRHVPVEMMWNCEGHSTCPGSTGPLVRHFDQTQVHWFEHWLMRKQSVGTGPRFTWIADNESTYRSAGTYPVPARGYIRGHGSGPLLLTPLGPLSSPGLPLLGAKPAQGALNIPLARSSSPHDVVGLPRLSFTYAGTARPARTWMYAQLVDDRTGRVVNSQVTPIPLTLDGSTHTARVRLNAVSTHVHRGARYHLQLMPGSLIYGLQRSTGLVNIDRLTIQLPWMD